MATQDSILPDAPESIRDRYRECLIKPMGRNGDPTIELAHVIDAVLVGAIVFAATLLVDVWPTLFSAQPVFLSPAQLLDRAPTAAIGALLAFAFQWARARGIAIIENLPYP